MTDSPNTNRPTADPLVGKRVVQYNILAKLGGGGMGVVYTARDTKLGRLVALKFLPPEWSHDETAKQRFIREAQAASATDHRNICTIHNIESTDDGRLFIVMAHYAGETLKQKLERGPLGTEEALEIAAQVAEGLAKAHAQGVVHRDIKPGNLMITDDTVKILDFGLAKFADSMQLTIVGSTLGTVGYMSPEQARGEEADARSDIWALGVVLYEMLTGQVPFKGAYAEAISYAIRNDPPPPLNADGKEIPEAVERLVLRALEKDPAARFQTARELARDLRLIQGRSVPIELRTEPLQVPQHAARRDSRSSRRSWRRPLGAAAAVLLFAIAGGYVRLIWPVERIPVAVAPVANQTGYAELEPYRLALTQTFSDGLSGSGYIRLIPYQQVLQIVRGLRANGIDPSSRVAVQAITEQTDAVIVIVPTLVHENGSWRARAEFRTARTATNAAVFETSPVVSSLIRDTPYSLISALVAGADEQFKTFASYRVRVVKVMRGIFGQGQPVGRPRLNSLDAAARFERGISAYEEAEYASALAEFAGAARLDPRNPLPLAWQSHVARLMWQLDQAAKAADQARALVAPDANETDVLFVNAVSAEARRNAAATADALYRGLTRRHPEDGTWIMELAGYQDRQLLNAEAIDSYHQALRVDRRLVRPHLELCRLYTRVNEPAKAKQEGELARAAYSSLRDRTGEARALWCLSDVARAGTEEERAQARRNAEIALTTFKNAGYPYSLSRAQNYLALAAAMQGSLKEAADLWEMSLTGAKEVGNLELQPLILMNLGLAHQRLGNRAQAVDYYQQSYALYQTLGQEQRAAEVQANAGQFLIEYGNNPESGLRDIQNALEVSRKLGNKLFEVSCLQTIAAYFRNAGRHADAQQQLNRALALAKERDLSFKLAPLTIDLAASRFEAGDYARARALLREALGDGSGPDSTEAYIWLARTSTRLGDFAGAEADFSRASSGLEKRGNLIPLFHLSMGELAHESGNRAKARLQLQQAALLWTDDLPDAASVEARAHLAFLNALEGRSLEAIKAVHTSLEQSRKMRRFSLEARIRVYLSQILVSQRKFGDALLVLKEIPEDGDRTLGPDLQAQVHHSRSQALSGLGNSAGAKTEAAIARKLVETLRASLPEEDRDRFLARTGIRALDG